MGTTKFFMEIQDLMTFLVLSRRGEVSPEQDAEIRRWLDEDEAHRRIYREVCEQYYRLNYAEAWEKIDDKKAFEVSRRKVSKTWRLRWQKRILSGIAALVMIGMGCLWLLRQPFGELPQVVAEGPDIGCGVMKACLTLANGEKVILNTGNKVNVDLGFAQAVEDSLVGLVYRVKDSSNTAPEYHLLSVPRAGEYIMTLSDGTKVWLNSETEMRYPVAFGAGKREVFITGEAYFEVVKDAERPFVVVTPRTKTTVLGTSFNIMAYGGERHTEITLVSGAVAVTAGKQNCRIVPGHQLSVDNESLEWHDRVVNVSFYTSWKNGLFDFDDMSLEELAAKLSRWYDVDFFFASRTAADKRFTGAIKRNRSLQFMLDFIQKTSGVRFERKGKTVTVYNN